MKSHNIMIIIMLLYIKSVCLFLPY